LRFAPEGETSLSGARLAAPFVEARRRDRRELGRGVRGCVRLFCCPVRPPFRFVEHGAAGEYLAPGAGLAFLLPLAPLSLAYAGL